MSKFKSLGGVLEKQENRTATERVQSCSGDQAPPPGLCVQRLPQPILPFLAGDQLLLFSELGHLWLYNGDNVGHTSRAFLREHLSPGMLLQGSRSQETWFCHQLPMWPWPSSSASWSWPSGLENGCES
jgi:hypothetical protein